MKYIIDTQTGTMVSAEYCYVVDEADFPEDLNEMSDRELSELASKVGARLTKIGADTGWGDNQYGYAVSYSPASIRDEASSLLDGGIYEDDEKEHEALMWASVATDEELADISKFIMSNDGVWDGFRDHLMEGLMWVYKYGEAK